MRHIPNAIDVPGKSLLSNKLHRIKYLLGLMLCVSGISLTVMAAPSDLDPTFGNGGKVVSNPDGSQSIISYGTALQPDGKIVMAGSRWTGSTSQEFVVARFNADGSLDTTFGSSGWSSATFGAGYEIAVSAAVQPDGKIVVGGTIRNVVNNVPLNEFGVVRFNPNGSLDTGFDGDGKLTIDFTDVIGGFYTEYFSALKIALDGKIVMAGYALNAGVDNRFVLARINPDGSPDAAFGTSGRFGDISNGATNHDRLHDMVVLPDGKIAVVGRLLNLQGGYRIAIKYGVNGGREWTYNQGAPGFPNENESLNGIAAQPDGKLIVVGKRSGVGVAIRLNVNGTEDSSFNNPSLASHGEAFSVAIQPDGKIVANIVSGNSSFSLVRYNANGSLDSGFGSGGVIVTGLTNGYDTGRKVLIQPDGKILVGGYSVLSSPTRYYFSMVRYKGDSSFSDNPLFDYDGDGKADLSVFRPSTGFWYISRPTGIPSQNFDAVQFGVNGDLPVPADYDGDGRTDVAVWRPSDGVWYLLQSTRGFRAAQFGANGDIPVPGDFDGDGKANLAVFRPSTGSWYIARATGIPSQNFDSVPFGANGDKPIVGADFDGDGRADVAVFRPSDGNWYRLNSSNGSFVGVHFGIAEDKPVAADYDGDGKTDLAVFRPSDGVWYRINSGTDTFAATQFGASQDRPSPADYDGDGKADLAVFRSTEGNWYLLRSTQGFAGIQFGANGDIPTPNSFVR